MTGSAAPTRPPPWEERWAQRLFLALSPRLPRTPQLEPPPELAPWQSMQVPRLEGSGAGTPSREERDGLEGREMRDERDERDGGVRREDDALTATWYEAPTPARGAVLLVHPWLKPGKAYFHRGGRIEALRAAGYHALALDLGGFGGSPPPAGFFDRDVEAGLAYLRRRVGTTLPLHLWGLSNGGYWSHPVLSRSPEVTGAMFEDVSPHLLEWSWRLAPWGAPGYLVFRHTLRRAYRFLDMRRHAAAFRLAAVSYVSGEHDRGVRPSDTRELAARAGGRHLIVAGAGHLGALRRARAEINALALDTFRRGEERREDPSGP